jgi:tRNA U34 5-methylaminomethyl-2-thiouridine-forming methyltransferase MnmC
MESLFSIPDLVMTQDGSYTLYSKDHRVTYHSKYGAIQESNHVFVDSGLLPVLKKQDKISILELGFGTGLNVLLTWKNIVDIDTVLVDYHSFDVYPLPEDLLNACVYEDHLKIPTTISKNILTSDWDKLIEVDSRFTLTKHNKDILEETLPDNYFDIVYFDAFSPESQPELWSISLFEKIHESMTNEAILVTYCAKGEVKRILKKIGFTLESLPGPPGKREMTRATKRL